MKPYQILCIVLLLSGSAAAIGTFANNELISIDLFIRQDHIGEESNNKHMEYTITDGAGRIIDTNKNRQLILLNGRGDYTKTFGEGGFGVRVKDDWFSAGTTSNAFKEWWSKAPESVSPTISAIAPESITLTRNGLPVQDPATYIIEIRQDGTSKLVEIFKGGDIVRTTGRTGGTLLSCSGPASIGQTVTCSDGTVNPIVLTFRIAKVPTDDKEKFNSMLVFNKGSANPCAGDTRFNPQPFKAIFNVYDSDQFGQPTNQLSIDPVTGADVTTTVTFFATCAKADEQGFIDRKVKAQGLVPGTELVAYFRNKIAEYITKETQHQQTFDELSKRTMSIVDEVTVFRTALRDAAVALRTDEEAMLLQTDIIQRSLTNTTDAKYAAVKTDLEDLRTNLTRLQKTINDILAALQTGQPPFDANVQKGYATAILSNITATLAVKNKLQTQLDMMLVTLPCPDKQKEGGKYYVCSATAVPGFTKEDARSCTTGTCYSIPETQHCSGEQGDYRYQCSASCDTTKRWQSDASKKCEPGAGVCCRQSVTEPIPPVEQVLLVYEYLYTQPSQIAEFTRTRDTLNTLANQDDFTAAQSLTLEGKQALITQLQGYRTSVQNTITALEQYASRTTIGPSVLPLELNYYLTNLRDVAGRWIQLIADAQAAQNARDLKIMFNLASADYALITDSDNVLRNELRRLIGKENCPVGVDARGFLYACRSSCPSGFDSLSDIYSCAGGQTCCSRPVFEPGDAQVSLNNGPWKSFAAYVAEKNLLVGSDTVKARITFAATSKDAAKLTFWKNNQQSPPLTLTYDANTMLAQSADISLDKQKDQYYLFAIESGTYRNSQSLVLDVSCTANGKFCRPSANCGDKNYDYSCPGEQACCNNLCRNGKLDAGEICDVDATSGKVIVSDTTAGAKPGSTYTFDYAYNGNYIENFVVKGINNQALTLPFSVRNFCMNPPVLSGGDCADLQRIHYEDGWCSSNCKEYRPQLQCYDGETDLFKGGDYEQQSSYWLAPQFTIKPDGGVEVNKDYANSYMYSWITITDLNEKGCTTQTPCLEFGGQPRGKSFNNVLLFRESHRCPALPPPLNTPLSSGTQ